jgi:GNAT superfamily N-acetyltransferase
MIRKIEDKMKSGVRCNEWISLPEFHMKLYYRLTSRYINHVIRDSIDIASVEIDEEFRGKGYFAKFMIAIEKMAKNNARVVYVESVLNFELYSSLLANGYKEAGEEYGFGFETGSMNLYKSF